MTETGKEFFMFNNQYYAVKINCRFTSHQEAIVFRGDEQIGHFVARERISERSFGYAYGSMFIHKNHIYYTFIHFRALGWRVSVRRHEYFRFNLLTGQNEEISLTEFVETLQLYNENFIIDPEWRGAV